MQVGTARHTVRTTYERTSYIAAFDHQFWLWHSDRWKFYLGLGKYDLGIRRSFAQTIGHDTHEHWTLMHGQKRYSLFLSTDATKILSKYVLLWQQQWEVIALSDFISNTRYIYASRAHGPRMLLSRAVHRRQPHLAYIHWNLCEYLIFLRRISSISSNIWTFSWKMCDP